MVSKVYTYYKSKGVNNQRVCSCCGEVMDKEESMVSIKFVDWYTHDVRFCEYCFKEFLHKVHRKQKGVGLTPEGEYLLQQEKETGELFGFR